MSPTDSIPNRRTYSYGAPSTSMLVNLDLARALVLMGSLVLAFAFMLSGQLPLGLFAIASGAALVFLRPGAKPAVAWLAPITRYLTRSRRITRAVPSGELMLEAAGPLTGSSASSASHGSLKTTRRHRHKNAATWPEPLGRPDITSVKLSGGEAAAWWQGRGKRPLVSVAWMCDLPHSFPLLGHSEQERFLDAWGQVLAGTCGQGSCVRRVSVIQRQVPDASDDAKAWIDEHTSDVDMMARRDYLALIDQLGAAAATSEVLVGLT
ncbi:MAG: hypothetical protein ACYDEY_15875, partial [Acidimicrobiales bacterium]